MYHGQGKRRYLDGVYEGKFVEGRLTGKVKFQSDKSGILVKARAKLDRSSYPDVYNFGASNPILESPVTIYYPNGDLYEGGMDNGEKTPSGRGVTYYANGDKFDLNRDSGNGTLTLKESWKSYSGDWQLKSTDISGQIQNMHGYY